MFIKQLFIIFILSISICAQSRLERGRQHYAAGRYQHAIAELDAAQSAHPKDADVFYLRGLVWLKLKDKWLARRDFRRAVKLNPQHNAARVMLASVN